MDRLSASNLQDDFGKYKYVGLPLQPSIFAEILLLLFNGKRFKREQAIEAVRQYHQHHGGSLDHFSGPGVFKKAASYLKPQGLTNVNYGYWTLEHQNVAQQTNDHPSPSSTTERPTHTKTYTAHGNRTIGEGSATVYVYYFDAYKEKAQRNGKIYWPCRIGCPDTDSLSRFYEQSQPCFPEPPHIALTIKCDDASTLETTIHGMLKLQGRQLTDTPGTEWFNTNPEDIASFCAAIFQNHI